MIEPASKTFLGKDQNKDGPVELYSSAYVQWWTERSTLLLSDLVDSCPESIQEMPKICYHPQETGSRRSFGYFYDTDCCTRVGHRIKVPEVIELFCGAGGMHRGYKANNFETVAAVDLNKSAIDTFLINNPEDYQAVRCVCVNDYLQAYTRYDNNVVEVLHASSPCQGFSQANRNGGKDDETNNELAFSFTEGLRKTKALIGIFENVSG